MVLIELDRTLHDLYALDNEDGPDHTLLYAIPSAKMPVTKDLPISIKYAYQGPRAQELPPSILARAALATGPQSHGFMAGKMPMILFNVEPTKDEAARPEESWKSVQALHADASSVYGQLVPEQRPELIHVTRPADVPVFEGHKVATLLPMDCLTHLPHVVHPDTHYDLLSKRGLAKSDLPGPRTQVIDCDLRFDQVSDESLVNAEASRMLEPVVAAIPPFVVKLPQALGSQGVWVVRNQEEQQAALEELNSGVKDMILQLNESNEHLCPSNLIIQDLLPGMAVCLSLFVTKAGRAVFTSCTEQMFDGRGNWSGGQLDYRQQDDLAAHYAVMAEELAKFVHQRGYYGPIGADIMTDLNGTQHCIDLNVRASGSYSIGFLRNHFSVKRGLHTAAICYPLALKGTQADFRNLFKTELEEGRIVIVGWAEDGVGPGGIYKFSITGMCFAAENPTELRELLDRVSFLKVSK
jgi:hypothetical protein